MVACRDRALLLIGFAGGLRRSELVGIDCRDIERVSSGIAVRLRRSKTDQDGRGRKITIGRGKGPLCPVRALERWLAQSKVAEGPVFRPIDRHGNVVPRRLSGEAVSLISKRCVTVIGLDPDDYSGHSLRAGFVTSQAHAGTPSSRIRQHTGHSSDTMLARYIRESELFVGSAAGA